MMRRGFATALLAFFFSTAMVDVALAADPPPAPSPPPQCFVVKDGALPTCELNPDGTWNVLYPPGGGNLKEPGSNNTTRNIELAVAIAALVGVAVIVYRTWLTPEPAAPAPDVWSLPPARLSGASVDPPTPPAASPAPPEAPAAVPPASTASPAQRLADLNALRNQGAISPEEYEARRQAIITETN